MSTSLIPAREGDTVVESSDGPGGRLCSARRAQGLTSQDVAEELHLSSTVIESLERDDYDALPNNVFVAGYIRKYARVVGLASEPLLDAYRKATPRTAPAYTGTTPRTGFRINNNLIIGLAGLGVLILLGVLVFLWWQGRQSDMEMEMTDDEVTQETAPAATLETVLASRTPLSPADTDLATVEEGEQGLSPGSDMQSPEQAGLSEPSAATATTAAEVDEEGADATTDAEETEATTTTRAGEVELIFDGPCWVDVRDNQEKYKLSGTKKKGERYVLEGGPPYSLNLGNPAVVRITVGGKPFDLGAVPRARGGRTRFTLNPDELP